VVGVLTLPQLRHLDVGFSFPGVATDPKGATVLCVIGNVSWVHTVVIQVGFYLLSALDRSNEDLVREERVYCTSSQTPRPSTV